MTQNAFHLTSHDIRAQEFHRKVRGYDPAQVDDFKERMALELDRMVRERVQLDERLKQMVEQLRVFRERERAMNEALIAAQQLRTDSQAHATREAELILQAARTEAEELLFGARADAQRILDSAQEEYRRLVHGSEALRRQFTAYMTSYRALLERELAQIEGLASMDGSSSSPSAEAELEARRQAALRAQ